MIKNLNYSSLPSSITDVVEKINGIIPVKGGRPLLRRFIQIVPLVVGKLNRSWVKIFLVYSNKLYLLHKAGGMSFVSLYCKTSSIMLQQAIGGERVHDLSPFGARVSRTKSGFPRIIPALQRARIRRGEKGVIRAWMTLFGIYRILEVPYKLRLSSITDPGAPLPGEYLHEFSVFVTEHFIPSLRRLGVDGKFINAVKDPLKFMGKLRAKPFLINKSSPTRSSPTGQVDEMATPLSTSMGSIRAAAFAWRKSDLFPMLEAWCKMTGSIWILNRIETWAPQGDSPKGEISLGKLGLKFEPAGKVRVFAMVDCFTQWMMNPLHKAIFDLLNQIPQDGTHDQLRPLRSMMDARRAAPSGMWSYDLSSATDRLPIVLQKVLLSPFLTSWGAEVWGSLLIGRSYYFPGIKSKGLDIGGKDLYYARGQPMGALSSWAMLAFTHHAIVQWASLRSNVTKKGEWFHDYGVLGDDIVIGNYKVAQEYLELMKILDVQISLHKSLSSNKKVVCEFAKRFFAFGQDMSGIPWREALLGTRMFPVLMELIRHYKLRLGIIFNYLGYGYRVRGSLTKPLFKISQRPRNVLLSMYAPGGPFALPPEDFFRLRSIGTFYASKGRWAKVIKDYMAVLVKQFMQSLDALDSLRDQVKALATVYRDREHYGTTAFAGERIKINGPSVANPEEERVIRLSLSDTIERAWSQYLIFCQDCYRRGETPPDFVEPTEELIEKVEPVPLHPSVSTPNEFLPEGRKAFESVSEVDIPP